MLGGGPASQHPRLQSQQIRGTLPRTVTLASLRYPQLLWILPWFCRHDAAGVGEKFTPPRDRAAASGLTMLQHGASCSDPEHKGGVAFINSKPQCGLRRRGESPLSGAAAFCRPEDGDRHGRAIR
jgi:hypothetical protein